MLSLGARGGTAAAAAAADRRECARACVSAAAAAAEAAVECRRAINVSPSGRPIGSRGSSPFAPAFRNAARALDFSSAVARCFWHRRHRPTAFPTERSFAARSLSHTAQRSTAIRHSVRAPASDRAFPAVDLDRRDTPRMVDRSHGRLCLTNFFFFPPLDGCSSLHVVLARTRSPRTYIGANSRNRNSWSHGRT